MNDDEYYDRLERLAGKRRKRYHDDPEFRARVLDHSRRWAKRQRDAGLTPYHKDEASVARRAERDRERRELEAIAKRYEERRAHRAMKNKYGAKNQRDYLQRLKDHGVRRMSEYNAREKASADRSLAESRARRRASSSE